MTLLKVGINGAFSSIAWHNTLSSIQCMYNCVYVSFFILFFRGSTALLGPGLLVVEFSSLHSDTPHSVGLMWSGDRPVTGHCTWQHTKLTRDKHPWPRRDSTFPIPATGRPQTHALDRAATEISTVRFNIKKTLPCAHTVCLYVVNGSQNKEQFFSCTAFTGCLYKRDGRCLLRGTDWIYIILFYITL